MAANNDPIYSRLGDIQSSANLITTPFVIAAVNASLYNAAGTVGTDVYRIWTADATNGGFLQRVRVKYISNGTTASNACVMKFFLSAVAGSVATTENNMFFYDEIALPTTGTLTTTAGNVSYDMPFGFALPPGWGVYAKITVAQPANSGWVAIGIGGKY